MGGTFRLGIVACETSRVQLSKDTCQIVLHEQCEQKENLSAIMSASCETAI